MCRLVLALLSIFIFCNLNTSGQETHKTSSHIKDAEKVVVNETTGKITLLTFNRSAVTTNPENASNWLREIFSIEGPSEFKIIDRQRDQLGFSHIKYQQYIGAFPVEHTAVTVHAKNGKIESVSGDYSKSVSINETSASIKESEAYTRAKEFTNGKSFWEEVTEEPELVIFSIENSHHLAYKTDVYSLEPLMRNYVYVDAINGEILKVYNRLHETDTEGTAVTLYNGNRTIVTDSIAPDTFLLHDYSRGQGIITKDLNGSYFTSLSEEIVDSDNHWESEELENNGALDAHWGAEMSFDYFLEEHNLNSFNGEGAQIRSFVDFMSSYNAFWDGNHLMYGDGGNSNPYTPLDVVAHELTHAVTQSSANLIYENESGALNESFSDIFSAAVTYYVYGSSADVYNLGEDLSGGPLRSMSDPNAHNQPDSYHGSYWEFGSNDNGGVHTNSGVQNFWFYLLAEGGEVDGLNINGIGIENATDIAFRALTVYLTAGSQYNDARNYSIQAAIDLFGNCSNEVIQVTNAWHAVGIGEPFDTSIAANFNVSPVYSCETPLTAEFTNMSINSSSWLWNFGDGDTSTSEHPVHTYTNEGSYDVSLISYGSGDCSISDTILVAGAVEVTNDGIPLATNCQPEPEALSWAYGITYFSLGNIENWSGVSDEGGYHEYFCDLSTELIEGSLYTLTAETNISERIYLWIDLNNDGQFTEEENLYSAIYNDDNHETTILLPEGIVYDTPLRMRVRSSTSDINSACQIVEYGETEDYQVKIIQNTEAPIADFISETTVETGASVAFQDSSLNVPQSWQWSFEGGSPATSSDQNPVVEYSTPGVYDVTLVVENENGSDTLYMENYIHVSDVMIMCEESNSNQAFGQLYDSGGPEENYSNEDSCSFLISPDCAQSITVNFPLFYTHSSDFLKIYDGTNNEAPLLLSASGSNVPASVTGQSGSLFIEFYSPGFYTRPGWHLTWDAVLAEGLTNTAFIVSDLNPALDDELFFTDQSTEYPQEWEWDFGDGNTSLQQNPSHIYDEPGTYSVTLTTTNCFGSTSYSEQVTVQEEPQINFVADTIHTTIGCGGTGSIDWPVINNGMGNLTYYLPDLDELPVPEVNICVLVTGLTNGASSNNLQGFLGLLSDANISYDLSYSDAENYFGLANDLEGKDLLIIPSLQSQQILLYSALSSTLNNFVSDGGNILIHSTSKLSYTGLFDSEYIEGRGANSESVNMIPGHPIMEGIPDIFYGFDYNTAHYDFFEEPATTVLTHFQTNPNYHTVAVKNIGLGKVCYVGTTFQLNVESEDTIATNAIEYLSPGFTVDWLTETDSTGIISPGDTLQHNFSIDAANQYPGDYYYTQTIFSNDQNNPISEVVIHLEVLGGDAHLAVESSELFTETIVSGHSSQDTIIVMNEGCLPLDLSTSLDSEVFSIDQDNLTIPAFSQRKLILTFHPEAPGSYSVQLNLTSNGGDETILIDAEAIGAPQIFASIVDTLQATILCNSSESFVFTIFNEGESSLELTQGNIGQASPSVAPKTMLFVNESSDQYREVFLETLNEYSNYQNIEIIESVSQYTIPLEEQLEGIDLLLVPHMNQVNYNQMDDFQNLFIDFLNNGGRILMSSNNYLNHNYQNNIFDGEDFGWNSIANVTNPTHPIAEGVENSFTLTHDATFYETTDDPDIIPIVQVQSNPNYSPVLIKTFEQQGLLAYVGHELHTTQSPQQQLLANSFDYLVNSFSPYWMKGLNMGVNESIPPGGSLQYEITFSGDSVTAGTYTYELQLLTNDPENPVVDYVFQLDFEGDPEMVIDSTEIIYDPLIAGFNTYDSLVIENDGCDSLFISTAIDNDAFSTVAEFAIAGYSQDTLPINFSPASPGEYSGELIVSGNAGTDTNSLYGVGLDAPDMTFSSPDTLHTVINCGNTGEGQFTIYNNGDADLVFNAPEVISDTISKEMLSINRSVDTTIVYPNILNAIDQYFDYPINYTPYFELGYDETVAALVGKDIVLIPYQPGTEYLFSWIDGPIEDFVEDGGKVLICGNHSMDEFEFFSNQGSAYSSATFINTAPQHPIMEDFPETYSATDMLFYEWGDEEDESHITPLAIPSFSAEYYLIAQTDFGAGEVVYLPFLYENTDPVSSRVISNAMKYLVNRPQPYWLENVLIDSTSIIAPGDSLVVDVELDATELFAGDYFYQTTYYSNSPQSDTLNYVFHMEVVGAPIISTDAQEVAFDSTITGFMNNDSIVIFNSGCEPLELTNVINNDNFTVVPSELTIPPYSQDTIEVIFQPVIHGTHTDTLYLNGNGVGSSIVASGVGLPAPIISATDSVELEATPCADSVLVSFQVINEGTSTLEFNSASALGTQIPLQQVLNNLQEHYTEVTELIPDRFDFDGGVEGTSIEGQNTMYDDGNYLSTNLFLNYNGYLEYSNLNIAEDEMLGPNSSYFTAKYPGLFVFAADIDSLESFRISGDLESYYSYGETIGSELTYNFDEAVPFTGFATRAFGGPYETVNHLVILERNPEAYQTHLDHVAEEDHYIHGLQNTERFYYLLFSSNNEDLFIEDSLMTEILGAFSDIVNTPQSFVSEQIEPGDTLTIEQYIDISSFEQGIHDIPIYLTSNDPLNPLITVNVTLDYPGNVCADAEIDVVDGCSGTVYFNDKSKNEPTEWDWDFGDGTTSNEENPIHTYTEAGEFEVTLNVCNELDCDSISQFIEINSLDTLNTPSCAPYSAVNAINQDHIYYFQLDTFVNESGGSPTSYSDFTCLPPIELHINSIHELTVLHGETQNHFVKCWIDLNNDGELTSPEIIFWAEGDDDMQIEIPDYWEVTMNEPLRMRIFVDTEPQMTYPCESIYNGEAEDYSVIVLPPEGMPSANFTWESLDTCQSQYQFTDLSTNEPTSLQWSFDDGTTSFGSNPTHTFDSGGDYIVQLTATNNVGISIFSDTITVPPQGFESIEFSGNLIEGEEIEFSAPADGVTSRYWDFGDGTTFQSSFPLASHTYEEEGTYLVSLSTTNDVCIDSVTTEVSIIPTSIEQYEQVELSIFPNPSAGKFILEYSNVVDFSNIQIFNALGQEVSFNIEQLEGNRIEIVLDNAEAGVYFVIPKLKTGLTKRLKIFISK